MDILTHTLSGMVAASAIAGLSKKTLAKKSLIISCGAIGAVLPDIDAITRWSRFDATIGKFLNLPQPGRVIYFSNLWYSHHNFFHSLAAAVLWTIIAGLSYYTLRYIILKNRSNQPIFKSSQSYLGAFFIGFCMHLAGDLPTPDTTWHGIKLFWPLEITVGGTGHTWWWNNYDIFLLFLIGSSASCLSIVFSTVLKKKFFRWLPVWLSMVVFSAAFFQITHRPFHFAESRNGPSHAEKEGQSLTIQQTILGNTLYQRMVCLDRRLKFPF